MRSFASFDAALVEIVNAGIDGGIHLRTSCDDEPATGTSVAKYVLANAFQRIDSDEKEDRGDD